MKSIRWLRIVIIYTLSSNCVGYAAELQPEPESRLLEKAQQERRWMHEKIFLIPHRPNYFLPWSYNTNPGNSSQLANPDANTKSTEMKFQISLKVSIARGLFFNQGDLYFAYTQLSMWQFYDRKSSAPFRDTNYEPEVFMLFDTNKPLFWMTNRIVGVGFAHQSNGQTDPLSRSWNRIYMLAVMEKNNWVLSVKPWLRLPETESQDDNSDMEKYLGYGELRLAHSMVGHRILSFMLRNNLRASGNKGALEAAYSFPFGPALRGYVQYFIGYGESLLDYDHPNQRLGFGIALSDWL